MPHRTIFASPHLAFFRYFWYVYSAAIAEHELLLAVVVKRDDRHPGCIPVGSTREERAKQGKSVAEPAQSSLIDLFVARATEAAAKVERVPRSASDVRAAIVRATEGARSLVVADGDLLPAEIFNAARSLPGVIAKPSDDQLSTADAGVTEAFAGSGSICIAMGPPLRATTSLLMPLHVALLPAFRIVARPRDLFEPSGIGAEAMRRNLIIVTGPSATADMGPLVRGVHGPHRLHILVLE